MNFNKTKLDFKKEEEKEVLDFTKGELVYIEKKLNFKEGTDYDKKDSDFGQEDSDSGQEDSDSGEELLFDKEDLVTSEKDLIFTEEKLYKIVNSINTSNSLLKNLILLDKELDSMIKKY